MTTKKLNVSTTSFNRMVNFFLDEKNDYQKQKLEVAEAILSNCPVLVNFNRVRSTKICNVVLSFLQGVIYPVCGECYKISDESYLFGTLEAFADGSLYKWIKNNGRL